MGQNRGKFCGVCGEILTQRIRIFPNRICPELRLSFVVTLKWNETKTGGPDKRGACPSIERNHEHKYQET